jgi:hypothetical protein
VSQRPAPEEQDAEERGHVSSVMPRAAASLPLQVETPPMKTPASMVPQSEGPEVSVGVLSMPHVRAESVVPTPSVRPEPSPVPQAPTAPAPHPIAQSPIATPGPILIPLTPAPIPSDRPPVVQRVVTLSANGEPPKTVVTAPPEEESSGVHHVLLRNVPGIAREVCSPVVFNRCS